MSTCKDRLLYKDEFGDIHTVDKINGKRIGDKAVKSKLFDYEQEEADGKLIHLPCKVGDKVYQIVYCYDRKTYPATKYPDHYVEREVVGIHICDSRLRVNALSNKKYRDYLIVGRCNALEHIPFAKIGKSVFPTKEEAEKALKERNNNDT